MATLIGNKDQKLDEALQREIVKRCNDAYDKGGADALKIIADTAKQFAATTPQYAEHAALTLYIVETVRASLQETVENQVHDVMPEEKLLVN